MQMNSQVPQSCSIFALQSSTISILYTTFINVAMRSRRASNDTDTKVKMIRAFILIASRDIGSHPGHLILYSCCG